MSYKFDSLLRILNRLDRGEKTTVNSLTDEFEMRERTVLRYIQSLKTAGYPVCYDKKRGSYVFEEDFSLRKPDISVEEQLAFAKNLLKNFGTGMEKSIATIEQKLSLKGKGAPRHIVIKHEAQPPVVQGILDALFYASENFRTIVIIYKSVYSKKEP